jgi:hypothetical protein
MGHDRYVRKRDTETLMDEQVRRVFGQALIDVLTKYRFRRIGGIDEGWFTRDYVNRDFGIHLVYHLNDREVSIMCLDRLLTTHSISSVGAYFSGEEPSVLEPADQARFIDQHYKRIARMLRRRDGGADLRGLHESNRSRMLARFGIQLPENPPDL